MRIKIVFLFAVFIFIPACGGKTQETQNSQDLQTKQILKLPSSKEIKVKRMGKMDFPYGQKSVFVFEYEIEDSIEDINALDKQVEEIWEKIRWESKSPFITECKTSPHDPL